MSLHRVRIPPKRVGPHCKDAPVETLDLLLWAVAAFVALVGLSRLGGVYRAHLAHELNRHVHQAQAEKRTDSDKSDREKTPASQ